MLTGVEVARFTKSTWPFGVIGSTAAAPGR